MDQQSSLKLTPAVSTARGRDAPVSEHEDVAEFSAIHASVQNHFDQERHLVSREKYKQDRSAALAEWRMLAA
jgi:hypothetical protein